MNEKGVERQKKFSAIEKRKKKVQLTSSILRLYWTRERFDSIGDRPLLYSVHISIPRENISLKGLQHD